MIKVYAWSKSNPQPFISDFFWVRVDQDDPLGEAERALVFLNGKLAGDRVLFMWHAFDDVDNKIANLMPQILNGYKLNPSYYEKFFFHLHELNAPKIDRIVLDSEKTISCWGNISSGAELKDDAAIIAFMTKLYADPLMQAAMSAEMKTVTPKDFVWGLTWHQALTAWNNWMNPKLIDAMQRALLDPFKKTFNYTPKISNFGDLWPTLPISDPNGWPLPLKNSALSNQDLGVSDESSPALYLTAGGQKIQNGGFKKHPRWNCLIDCVNTMIAVPGKLSPWVSWPSYGGDDGSLTKPWAWEKLIRFGSQLGASTWLYWNPTTTDDAFASKVFGAQVPLTKRPTVALIPFDAEEIVIGKEKVTYTDFMANGI